MPYLLLIIGLIIGFYALYRFFMNASVEQIKSAFLTSILLVVGLAVFVLAVTGRLPAALAIVGAAFPIAAGWLRIRLHRHKSDKNADEPNVSSRSEALDILGLEDAANEEEIRAAYKKLMQKVHPDNEGSDWMAAKLNQARDILLKQKAKP